MILRFRKIAQTISQYDRNRRYRFVVVVVEWKCILFEYTLYIYYSSVSKARSRIKLTLHFSISFSEKQNPADFFAYKSQCWNISRAKAVYLGYQMEAILLWWFMEINIVLVNGSNYRIYTELGHTASTLFEAWCPTILQIKHRVAFDVSFISVKDDFFFTQED